MFWSGVMLKLALSLRVSDKTAPTKEDFMKTMLMAALVLAAGSAGAQVKENEYEIRNACKVNSRLYTPDGAPAELELRVEDAANLQNGFASFKKLVHTVDDVLVPLMGFNLCDSYSHSGSVAMVLQVAGDYQRISMTCGGTWQPILGEASITIQRSTLKAVQARVRLEGAYGNGQWHSGIVKKVLESFSCESSEYANLISVLFDGPSVRTVKGTLVKGVFTKAP